MKNLQPEFLRISVTNGAISQMECDTDTSDPYGFIVNFPNATLADANDHPLLTGFVSLDVKPAGISPICVLMLMRLLQPFQGIFDIDVMGTYSTDPATNVTVVLAESVGACNIQPS